MKHLFRVRPSPAMVVAAIALLVALGGTSVAAVTLVVPSRNTVGTLQLKANAVNSSKILNGSILKADIRASAIPAGAKGATGAAGPQGPQGAAGAAGPAGAAGVAPAGFVAEVKTAASTSPTDVTSTTYANLSTATATVTVPSGETGRVLAFFSAEDSCFGVAGNNERCLVKILVDGTELEPAANTDAFFDNNGHASTANGFPVKNDNDSVSSRAIVRSSGTLAAGAHVVVVQAATTNSSLTFHLDDWSLIVQRVKL